MSQQPASRPPDSVGAFIGGLFVGLLSGGVAMLVLLAFFLGLLSMLAGTFMNGALQELPFVVVYVIAILVGVLGISEIRRRVGFVSGLIVGIAAGLLGSSALCNLFVGGLNNMH